MGWQDHTFPTSDDPNDVDYMIMYWRKVKCPTNNCGGQDYILESRQFDHLPSGISLGQARQLFNRYVAEKKASGKQDSIKGLTLFLCEVVNVEQISDDTGEII